MDTKNKVRHPLPPAFLVFFLSFLSNEMMNKAMCNHPKHGDSFIQATILEQLIVYTEKNWHPRFFSIQQGQATTAESKGAAHTIRKEKENRAGSQL